MSQGFGSRWRARWIALAACGLLAAAAGAVRAGGPAANAAAGEWWLGAVDATGVASIGPGVPVLIVDRGLDLRHPDFAGRPHTVALNRQAFDHETDDGFHATAMASLVGSPGRPGGLVGIYPHAKIDSWDASPDGLLDTVYVLAGLRAASRHCPGVILLSFGLSGAYFVHALSNLQEGIDSAVDRGCLVVAAAGNGRRQGSPAFYPADLRHVLTVAATDPRGAVADFSSASAAVDLAAPGVGIPIAVPPASDPSGYSVGNGTSYAAAIVAGAAARVWTARPALTASQVADVLRRSARGLGRTRPNRDTGWGLLDLAAALRTPAPPPDPYEPNDDVWYDLPLGQPNAGSHPLTTPGRPAARLTASVSPAKDPIDLYRVWVPAGGAVTVRLRSPSGLGLRLWSDQTQTIAEQGTDRRSDLLATAAPNGGLSYRNPQARGRYLYVEVEVQPGRRSAVQYGLSIATAGL